jgi:predicted short-subunit dehydrogenase-like oxidoreductase (DUF2520 family)
VLSFSLSLVGPGRAGSAFARSWLAAGGSLREVIARNPAPAHEAAERLGGGTPRAIAGSLADCEILVVAVPDDAISSTARLLAGRLRCRAAFHLSGALAASALEPLRPSAVSLGSLHPLRVFTGSPDESWNGAFVATEGDAEALRVGEQVVSAVGARAHRIMAEAKPLYHAAAALAAGGTVAVISMATRAWGKAGIREEEARPALAALAESAAAATVSQEFSQAFTGPVARRERVTLAAHRAALAGRTDLLEVYSLLAREALERTPGRGSEEEIRSLFKVQGSKKDWPP